MESLNNNYFSNKNKILSTITSSNYSLSGHIDRLNLLKYLDDNHFEIDIFGKIFENNVGGQLLKSLKNYKKCFFSKFIFI